MKAKTSTQFLEAAVSVQKERAAEYERAEQGGERSAAAIATAFNAITGRTGDQGLCESEAWLFLQLLKQVRLFTAQAFHYDSALDNVSYAALTAEARQRERAAVTEPVRAAGAAPWDLEPPGVAKAPNGPQAPQTAAGPAQGSGPAPQTARQGLLSRTDPVGYQEHKDEQRVRDTLGMLPEPLEQDIAELGSLCREHGGRRVEKVFNRVVCELRVRYASGEDDAGTARRQHQELNAIDEALDAAGVPYAPTVARVQNALDWNDVASVSRRATAHGWNVRIMDSPRTLVSNEPVVFAAIEETRKRWASGER